MLKIMTEKISCYKMDKQFLPQRFYGPPALKAIFQVALIILLLPGETG